MLETATVVCTAVNQGLKGLQVGGWGCQWSLLFWLRHLVVDITWFCLFVLFLLKVMVTAVQTPSPQTRSQSQDKGQSLTCNLIVLMCFTDRVYFVTQAVLSWLCVLSLRCTHDMLYFYTPFNYYPWLANTQTHRTWSHLLLNGRNYTVKQRHSLHHSSLH